MMDKSQKHIYLMRHGTSPSSPTLRDLARPLSDQGKQESQIIGKLCAQKNFAPDIILCSEALRTRQTLDHFQQGYENAGTTTKKLTDERRFYELLYHGATGDYFHLIQSLPETTSSVLVIGHNPITPALAAMLSDDQKQSPQTRQTLLSHYTPATLATLKCPSDKWQDIQPSSAAIEIYKPTPQR